MDHGFFRCTFHGDADFSAFTYGLWLSEEEVTVKAEKNTIRVNEGAIAVGLASFICFLGTQAAAAIGWPDAGKPSPSLPLFPFSKSLTTFPLYQLLCLPHA